MGQDAAAAAKPRGSARVASNEISPKSAHGQAVRRKRPESDAESCGEGRAEISLLRVAQSDQRDGGFGRRGWRLPAPEIERTVAASACKILSDETAIAKAAQAIGLADNRLPSLFSLRQPGESACNRMSKPELP